MSANEVTENPNVTLGERVLIDVVFMGVTLEMEVIVVQIDGDRIIGRPEGAHTTFARTAWRAA